MPVEHTMDLQEYFGQKDFYFSESEQAMLPLEGMVYPHLVNSLGKLIREWGDEFTAGTPLFQAMFAIACPNGEEMQKVLSTGQTCAYWLGCPGAKNRRQVRSAAIAIANSLGVVLKFEKVEDFYFMTPESVPDINWRNK